MFNFIKRIFLFLAVNFLVMMTVSLIVNLFGLKYALRESGFDYRGLLIFCFIWGFTGALISLALSRWMAKKMMRIRIIDSYNPKDHAEEKLVEMMRRLCRKAHLHQLPEIGIYDSPEINAFATGPTKNRSLVAVSSGLMHHMSDDQIEGIIGHELSHIANGDMVTMTLLQGVTNAFVMFLSRIIAYIISSRFKDEKNKSSGFIYYICVFVLELVLMLLGSLLIAAFSRYREYKADEGGARLAGKQKMISALEGLQAFYFSKTENVSSSSFDQMKIHHKNKTSLFELLASHPPLESRIDTLKKLR
ncbi:MAG: protease HtpX [Rhabdochlamydiaceae bacterium]